MGIIFGAHHSLTQPEVSLQIMRLLLQYAFVITLIFGVVLGSACETPKEAPEELHGVTLARKHLYPYLFDETHTLKGTRLLQEAIEQDPEGEDAHLARWLLARTHLDMLTTVITLQASGEHDEARVLLVALATELGTVAEIDSCAKTLLSRLALIEGEDAIAREAAAAEEFARAITLRKDPRAMGEALNRCIAGVEIVSYNARLLLAAQLLELFQGVRERSPDELAQVMAARYPFPCPSGFARFSKGGALLEGCPFDCVAAGEGASNEALLDSCGPRHFGFVDREDAAYLTQENLVTISILRHAWVNLEALREEDSELPLAPLHQDFIATASDFLSQLNVPAFFPMMSPEGEHLTLPSLPFAHPLPAGLPQVISLTQEGIYVDIPAHFRIERGQIYLPEVILDYRFPGRLAREHGEEVAAQTHTIPELMLSLDDVERDRPRLSQRLGDLVPGALNTDAGNPFGLERTRAALRWTGIVADEGQGAWLKPALKTLRAEDYGPFLLVVWSERSGQPAAVPFHAALEAPEGIVVHLGTDQWTLARSKGKSMRHREASFEALLLSLYDALQGACPCSNVSLRVEDELSLAQLAMAIEVMSLAAEVSGNTRAPEDAHLSSLLREDLPRHDLSPRVTLVLGE